jgi:hypothetical protein
MFSLFCSPKRRRPPTTPPQKQKHHPPHLTSPTTLPQSFNLTKREQAGSQAPKGGVEQKKTTQNLTFDSISNCNSTNPTTRTDAAAAINRSKTKSLLNQQIGRQTKERDPLLWNQKSNLSIWTHTSLLTLLLSSFLSFFLSVHNEKEFFLFCPRDPAAPTTAPSPKKNPLPK